MSVNNIHLRNSNFEVKIKKKKIEVSQKEKKRSNVRSLRMKTLLGDVSAKNFLNIQYTAEKNGGPHTPAACLLETWTIVKSRRYSNLF